MTKESRGTVAERGVAERTPSAKGDVFYRGLVAGMRCAILTIDRDGLFLSLNGLAAEILDIDVPGAECEGHATVAEVLGRHERLAQVLVDSLEMSHPPNRDELEISTRNGGSKTIGFIIGNRFILLCKNLGNTGRLCCCCHCGSRLKTIAKDCRAYTAT